MKIQFKDFETKRTLTTDLNEGDAIEYKGVMYRIVKVGEKMCRLNPVNNGMAMWITYNSLFNTFPEPTPPPKFN